MAEIPEHLLKRAQAAREKAESQQKAETTDSTQPKEPEETEEVEEVEVLTDENAEEALSILETALEGKILDSHIAPGRGLWIRVDVEDWRSAAKAAKGRLGGVRRGRGPRVDVQPRHRNHGALRALRRHPGLHAQALRPEGRGLLRSSAEPQPWLALPGQGGA